ncbi:MAG: phosphate ABC transporter permease PstA [Candidatus Bilamarchaeaceae archaeon]
MISSSSYATLTILLLLIFVLMYQSWPALIKISELEILQHSDWDPDRKRFGALLFIYGSIITSIIALLISVPLGVGTAVYLSEIAPPIVRKTCSLLLELLAAIPSVIYGFWAVEFLARKGLARIYNIFNIDNQSGEGIITAGLVLSIMTLPYIISLTFDACQSVPRSLREASLALGSSQGQTIWKIVLPNAQNGIIAACFLALGRALGETMAVTMVIGNARHLSYLPTSLGDSIPSLLAKQLHETSPNEIEKRSVLIFLGLILFLITLTLNVIGRSLMWLLTKHRKHTNIKHQIIKPHNYNITPTVKLVSYSSIVKVNSISSNYRKDWILKWMLSICQIITILPLFLIIGFITYKGISHLSWSLFTHLPNDNPPGLSHALIGSVILVTVSSLFAVPIGLFTAIFLCEYPKNYLSNCISFSVELLAGIPSIIVGIFIYAILVYPFWLSPGESGWGFSGWAGVAALGVLMLPIVIRSAEEAIRSLPKSLREASYALGANQHQTILKVVVPACMPAIMTGILLAIGRIVGETAPLILTARGSQYYPRSLSDPIPSIPYYIYDFATKPDEARKNLAWAAAFVLIATILLLNISARMLVGRRKTVAES